MARVGVFDPLLLPKGWACNEGAPEGWFDPLLLQLDEASAAYELDAQPGVFALSGADAGVVRGLQVDAQPGAYVVTGSDAGLDKGAAPQAYELDAQPAAFLLAGADAGLEKWAPQAYELDAQPGAFVLSGAESGLVWSGEPVVEVEAGQTPAGRKLKSRKERRWRVIDDRAYLVNDAELVDLLADLVEAQPVPEKVRQQPVKRPQKRQQAPERITLPAPELPSVEARFEALQHEFTIRADLSLLDALAAAMARIELDTEEEELMLLMA